MKRCVSLKGMLRSHWLWLMEQWLPMHSTHKRDSTNSGQKDLGFFKLQCRLQHLEEQKSQKWELSTLINSSNYTQTKSNPNFDWNELNKMNQAQTYWSIKLKFHVTLKICNHFTRFKLHCNQHERIFLKHVMILEMVRVENLPNLRNSCDSMVVWL